MPDTVCVDFDGTLCDASGTPLPGAVDWLTSLTRRFRVVVFTCRAREPEGRRMVQEWCVRRAGLSLEVTDRKLDALWYIDNKAYRAPPYPSVEELSGDKEAAGSPGVR